MAEYCICHDCDYHDETAGFQRCYCLICSEAHHTKHCIVEQGGPCSIYKDKIERNWGNLCELQQMLISMPKVAI